MTVALLTAAVFYLSDENKKRVKFFVVKSFRGNKRKRITKDLTPMAHGFWPIQNQGEEAVFYCFMFVRMATQGAGIWSIDGAKEKR